MVVLNRGEIRKELVLMFLTATQQALRLDQSLSMTSCPKPINFQPDKYNQTAPSTSAASSTSGNCTCTSTTTGKLFNCNRVTRKQFESFLSAVHIPSLHAIVAHNSNLAGLSPHFIGQFKNLRRLELIDCKLTTKSFDCNMLDGMTQLQYINLSNNSQIRSLCANFLTPKRPTQRPFVVRLQNIGLTRLPKNMFWRQPPASDEDLGDAVKFRVIDLSDNKLTTLEAGLFDGLTFLEALDLSNNGLTVLDRSALIAAKAPTKPAEQPAQPGGNAVGLRSLKYLNLDRNALSALHRTTLAATGGHKLRELSIAHNRLQKLSLDVFKDVKELTSLDLGSNRITSLPNELFRDLAALTTLVLNRNSIKSLPTKLFSSNTALLQLGLAGFAGAKISNSTFSAGPNVLNALDLSGSKVPESTRKALAKELGGVSLMIVRSRTGETIDKMK